LTLVFGKIMHSSESISANRLDIENRAKITVPWSVAKLIATALSDTITKYESKNGKLNLPGEYGLP